MPYSLAAGSISVDGVTWRLFCCWTVIICAVHFDAHILHTSFALSWHPGFQTHLSLPLTFLRHVKMMQRAVWMLPWVSLGQSMCWISKVSKLAFLSLIRQSLTLLDASYSVNWSIIGKVLIAYWLINIGFEPLQSRCT